VTTRIYSADGTLVRQIEKQLPDSEANDNVCSWRKVVHGTAQLPGRQQLHSQRLYIVNISAMGTGQSFGGQSLSYTKGVVVMK